MLRSLRKINSPGGKSWSWEMTGDASEVVDFFQPTTQPTKTYVLYDFRVVWRSPRSCKLSFRVCLPRIPSDKDKRIGGLVLEAKGDFCNKIKEVSNPPFARSTTQTVSHSRIKALPPAKS
jgi:hypothetical protein